MDALKAGLSLAPEKTASYHPWSPNQTKWDTVDAVVIAPPLPWTDCVYILAVKENISAGEKFSGQIDLPFALQTGITRAIYNLIQALQEREEKDWFIYDTVLTKYWERKGPYLFPKVPEEKYEAFVKHCLKMEIAVNPDYNGFSIVPFGADKGVFTKLKNSPFVF